jgi:tRNA (guanine37-N1)-methyltransferase
MLVHILTLFPDMFLGPLNHSIVGRAVAKGLLRVQVADIRNATHDVHHSADDYQYGGGAGMVMKPEPIFETVEGVLGGLPEGVAENTPVILMSPQGVTLSQGLAFELATYPSLVVICGHYQGVDARVRDHLATHELSIGDYVLTGGELAAMVLVDCIARLLPGVVGSIESVNEDSITSGLLQYPLYTRPKEYRGWDVPEVLVSGNHLAIALWRRQQSLLATVNRRPDLLCWDHLSKEDKQFLRANGFGLGA